MSYLLNISRLQGKANLGGILEIQVARKADVLSIPSPVSGVVSGDITFAAGTGFRTWRVTQESPNIKSTSRQSREGTSKSNRLPFRLPLDQASLRAMLEQAEEDEFIVLFKYPNGKWKLFGTLDQPVRFSFDHDSGSSFADGNFNNCEFYYDGPGNIFFYDGEAVSAPPGAAPALVRFNGTVIAALESGESLNIISDFGFSSFYITS